MNVDFHLKRSINFFNKYLSKTSIEKSESNKRKNGLILAISKGNFNYKIDEKIWADEDKYYSQKTSKEELRLRRIFKDILFEEQLKVVTAYGDKLNENILLESFPILEAAHLVSVNKIKTTKNYFEIINPNNGLLIDPNLHSLIDSCEDKEFKCNLLTKTGEIFYKGKLVGKLSINTVNKKKEFIERSGKFIID